MSQRSLQSLEERAAEDAGVLTVQHVWPDHGYTGYRGAAVGPQNRILHVDTPAAGRFTAVFVLGTQFGAVIDAVTVAKGLTGDFILLDNVAVLDPRGTLASYGLENDTVLDMVAA